MDVLFGGSVQSADRGDIAMRNIARTTAVVLIFAAGFIAGTYHGFCYDDYTTLSILAGSPDKIEHEWWTKVPQAWYTIATLALLAFAGLIYALTRKPKDQEHTCTCTGGGCGKSAQVTFSMKEAVQPEFRDEHITSITYEMLNESTRAAIRAAGHGSIVAHGHGLETRKTICPPST
jgi:hypothetical protein